MKRLKLVLCLLYLVNLSYSQEEKKALKAGWNMNTKKIIEANKNAIFVINGTILNEFVMEKIASINIDSIQVLKSENSVLKYGEIGKNGAILICTKKISKPDLKNLYKLYPFTLYQNTNQKAKKISGTVTDCESIPLQNIMVENLNSKINTSTDSLGKYTLEVRKNDIISFTNKSYKTERIQYQKQKNITISLKEKPISDKIMVKKPVIYLYPTKKTDIELQINFDGKLLTTFPKLENSWKVTAYENGQIFDNKTNRFYNSLFWDGEISFPSSHYQYKNGFIVEKENLTSFLIEKLEFMGLNTTETNDFIQYWLPILEKNKTNFIHFLVNNGYNVFSTNTVNPKPDTTIRIFMEFCKTEKTFAVIPQPLPKTIRKGFTLVEWGGADVSNQNPWKE